MVEREVSRRRFLSTAQAALALSAFSSLPGCGNGAESSSTPPAPAAPRVPPNFLVIITDDQRFDTLGCAGHPIIRTPVIDSLAKQGTRFASTYVTTSICPASRTSIFTSLYERTHQFTFGAPPIAQKWVDQTYPKLLRQAGYRTALFGKLDVSLPPGASEAMFDRLVDVDPTWFFHTLPDRTASTKPT